MRLYFEVGKRAFQRQLAYRTANLAGLITNGCFGYLRAVVFLSVYQAREIVAGYDVISAVTFTWVTQALIMVVALWGWWEVEETIRSGDVVSDLSKPFSYLGFWLARDYGRAAYYLIFRCVPIFVIGQLTFGMRWPTSPIVWLALVPSLILAIAISFAWRFILNLTAFWTTDARGIGWLGTTVVTFLCGLLVPLPYFPDELQVLLRVLPFASMMQIPADIFLERLSGDELLRALGQQALWAVVMLGAGRMNETASTTRSGQAGDSRAAIGADDITLREYLALYWRLVGARARSQMQYKLSFALLVLTGVAAVVTDFLAVVVLFGRIPHLAGWSLAEIALLFGTSTISFRLAEMLASGFDVFHRHIVQGTFDRVLTRPLGAFFQVFASELAFRRMGPVTQGLVILLVAQQHLAVHWTLDKLLVLVLGVLAGVVIFFSICVMGAASTFWTIQANEAVAIFTNGGVTMASYPLDIYHNWLRRFVTFVVPLAFINYYPALYLLDRRDPLGLPSWIGLLSPVAAAVFALLAWVAWSVGVRHYSSVGH